MAYEKNEKLPMRLLYDSANGKMYGHIELSELAYSLTVKISLNGKEIRPVSFDYFGHPIFSEEQARIYKLKNFEYKRENGNSDDLKLNISYRVDTSHINRSAFDSLVGIENSLVGLRDFNTVLAHRARYKKRNPNVLLNAFVVFGKIFLDEYAQVWSVDRNAMNSIVTNAPVETFKQFKINNPNGYTFVRGAGQIVVPKANSICPCCGKHLTIYDVRDNYCVCVDGKFYHESCYHELEKCNEILEIITNIVNCAYGDEEYQYDLLPNGYCNGKCCAHIPWFVVHTKYGDIVIGKRKRVISIEWQENFKSFDMNELFASEDVTKWVHEGKRGIHAWTKNKAIVYLMKVHDFLEETKKE